MKRRLTVLKMFRAAVIIDALVIDMSFTRWEQELSNRSRLRDAIVVSMKVEDGDPRLSFRFLGKPYASHYLIYGGSHLWCTLVFKVR